MNTIVSIDVVSDVVWFPVPARQQIIYLGNGGVLWTGTSRSTNIYVEWKYRSAPAATNQIEHMAITSDSILEPHSAASYHIWRVRYWSIVIPLTLLSAWLLVSKGRSSNELSA